MRRSVALLAAASFVLATAVSPPIFADPPKTLWEELGSPLTGAASGAYDPGRRQMVLMVRGLYSDNNTEVWAYDFTPPSPQWKHLLPYNTLYSITPSSDWGVVYDALRDRFVSTAGIALSGTTPRTWTVLGSGTSGHRGSAVLDPFMDRLVNYDGNGAVQTLDLKAPTSWVALATTGTPPPNRGEYTVTFDTDHRRLIVFGGSGSSGSLNDVWSLSLTGTPTWTRVFPLYGPPSARRGHVAIYDSRHRRMIIMGGYDGYSQYSDAWELSLTPGNEYWSYIAATAPNQEPAIDAAAADDSLNDRLIVYAAQYGQGVANQIQSLTLSGDPYLWTRHSPQTLGGGLGPCVYDTLRRQMVTYASKQLWAMPLDGAAEWQQLTTATTGPDLTDHAMIYDPVNDRLVMFAGTEINVGLTNSIRTLTLTEPRTWGAIVPSGTPPPVRGGACAVYDPVASRMVCFGGWSNQPGVGATNDAYGISLTGPADWTPLPATNLPTRRSGALAIYDSARKRLVIHGGTNPGYITYDDTWALPLDGSPLAWSRIVPQGTAPQVKYRPVAYDPVRDRMVVMEGTNGPTALTFSGTPTWNDLVMFGARPGSFQNESGLYDPKGDRVVATRSGANPWSLRFSVPGQLAVPPPAGEPGTRTLIAPAISALHPNPARGAFTLEYSLPNQAPATAELFDVRGRRVFRSALSTSSAGRQQFTIDPQTSLAPGLYFVRVAQSGKFATSRIAIVR